MRSHVLRVVLENADTFLLLFKQTYPTVPLFTLIHQRTVTGTCSENIT